MSANLNITYPKVSICMPTYNRNEFLPLMIQNLKGFVYPDKSLLEWVIDDDGTERLFKNEAHKKEVEQEIYPITINYLYNKNKRGIGQKRNAMVKQANYKTIAMMDSDDLYLPSYIQYSIELMKKNQLSLVGSNQMIFCYPFENFAMSAIRCEAKRQIHEATMCFTKKHWQSMGGFAKNSQGEGAKMVDFNDKKCGVSRIDLCMICICHKHNTINKDKFLKEDNRITGSFNPEIKKIIEDIFNLEPHVDNGEKDYEIINKNSI